MWLKPKKAKAQNTKDTQSTKERKWRRMKKYSEKDLERFDEYGYTVHKITNHLVLIRRYSKNAKRFIARFPIYDLWLYEKNK